MMGKAKKLAMLASLMAISGVDVQKVYKGNTVKEPHAIKGFGLPHKIRGKIYCPQCYQPGHLLDSNKVMYEKTFSEITGEKCLVCPNCLGYWKGEI